MLRRTVFRGLDRSRVKKGRWRASGPSLGRKRPRRAAVTRVRYRTAEICHRAAQNARGKSDIVNWCLDRAYGPGHYQCAGVTANLRIRLIYAKKGRQRRWRPKSREETPKEGSGHARMRDRTARRCGRGAQNARGKLQISRRVPDPSWKRMAIPMSDGRGGLMIRQSGHRWSAAKSRQPVGGLPKRGRLCRRSSRHA